MHLHEENLSNKLLFFLLNAIMGSGFSGTFVNALIKLRDYLIKVCHYTTLIDNKKERFRYLNRYLESNETYYELALIVTKVTSFTGQTALAATAVDDTATSVVTTSFIEYDDDANNKEHTKNDFFKYFIENFHNLIVEDSKTTSKNETWKSQMTINICLDCLNLVQSCYWKPWNSLKYGILKQVTALGKLKLMV
jgi:hypothetical protein